MHMDYNFVVFGYDSGFYRTVLSDIMGLNSVIYRDLWGTKNKIAAMIYKLYFTPRLPNRHFPFKNLLYHAACDFHFADNRPICFLSFGRNFSRQNLSFPVLPETTLSECKICALLRGSRRNSST